MTGNKLRPAVILISTKFDVTLCFITTQLQFQSVYDIKILPSEINGLKKESILRINKIATLDKNMVLGKIGMLDKNYIELLNNNLKEALQLV